MIISDTIKIKKQEKKQEGNGTQELLKSIISVLYIYNERTFFKIYKS